MTILATGSTGQLGSRVYRHLVDSGHAARGVSRHGGENAEKVDLLRHADLAPAFAGVRTIVHCAQGMNKSDPAMALHLALAAKRAKVEHIVVISIVGIDEIPLGFYRQRLLIERVLTREFPRVTIQRSTQFHSLIDQLFTAQRPLPAILVPAISAQPIAVDEVAVRLCELAVGQPRGRVEDIGGPEVLPMRRMFDQWRASTGRKRPGVSIRLPGRTFRAFREGANLAPDSRYGKETFEEFLKRRYNGLPSSK